MASDLTIKKSRGKETAEKTPIRISITAKSRRGAFTISARNRIPYPPSAIPSRNVVSISVKAYVVLPSKKTSERVQKIS